MKKAQGRGGEEVEEGEERQNVLPRGKVEKGMKRKVAQVPSRRLMMIA
jgi:hypothetical protein